MLFFTDCLASTQYRVDISSFKLEEGNIATDWTPSAEDIDQSVKAQISMCVQKGKNNKLTSAIAIEGNMISIKSDNFELSEDGTITKCQGATITNGIVDVSSETSGIRISDGEIKQYTSKYGTHGLFTTVHYGNFHPMMGIQGQYGIRFMTSADEYSNTITFNDGKIYLSNYAGGSGKSTLYINKETGEIYAG